LQAVLLGDHVWVCGAGSLSDRPVHWRFVQQRWWVNIHFIAIGFAWCPLCSGELNIQHEKKALTTSLKLNCSTCTYAHSIPFHSWQSVEDRELMMVYPQDTLFISLHTLQVMKHSFACVCGDFVSIQHCT
jgi:hypothetical protein